MNIRFKFEYGTFSSVIDDPDLGTLVGWLTNNSNNRRTYFTGLKDTANNAAGTYNTSKASYDAATKGVAGIDAQITVYTTSVDTLNTQQKADTTSNESLAQQIVTKAAELSALQAQQATILSSMNARASQLTSTQENLDSLKKQKTAGTSDATTYKTAFDAASTAWTTATTNLKGEAKNQVATVETANTELVTNNNLDKAKAAITSVWPA